MENMGCCGDPLVPDHHGIMGALKQMTLVVQPNESARLTCGPRRFLMGTLYWTWNRFA